MTPANPLSLRLYLMATALLPWVGRWVLRRRLAMGKEDPARWTEKLGHPGASRPPGPLIWINAVGLGEVMSLRGLIPQLTPRAHVLVTSTTRAGAAAFASSLPARTIHQYLPLDLPAARRAFLDHWRPDLAVWAEQDLWPGLVVAAHDRGIPQAMIAVRMNAAGLRRHRRAAGLFAALYARMALIEAGDAASAAHLRALGAPGVRTGGSLKPAAPALAADPEEVTRLRAAVADRFIWIVAPAHAADVAVALEAHAILRQNQPDALLIVAPRFPDRAPPPDLPHARRSRSEVPRPDQPVWLADTMGELGLFYRLSRAALIGGTFDHIEGHNPWEAARLGVALFHGPHTANFADDFAGLDRAGAAIPVTGAGPLAAGLAADLGPQITAATAQLSAETARTHTLARDLLALMDPDV